LSSRTAGRTVPDMFGRPRTAPDRELAVDVEAFQERLTGTMVTARTEAPRIDPRALRRRLGGSSAVGLRERLDRRPAAT
jgi:hypothetical protein